MANIDRPNGLQPIRTLGQSSYCGHGERMVVLGADTTNTFKGDPVVTVAGGSDATGKTQACAQGAAAGPWCGVIVGIEPLPYTQDTSDDRTPIYIDGAVTTDQYVFVDQDSKTVFSVQEVTGGTDLVAASAGLNINASIGTGDTSNGASAFELDTATEATTSTLAMKLLKVENIVDNDLGPHCNWEVLINDHQYGSVGTPGI